jgi:TolB-like protein
MKLIRLSTVMLLAIGACTRPAASAGPAPAAPPVTAGPAESVAARSPTDGNAPAYSQGGAPAAGRDTVDTRPGIAVFPFENTSIGPDRAQFELLGIGVQQMLTYELAQNTNLRVIDRAVLRELMAEQDLGASGRVDAETAARIGRIVGAKYVVMGGFMDNSFGGGDFQITGRIVDAETTEVLRPAAQAKGTRAQINRTMVQLASDLTRHINLPPLPAAVREARLQRPITPEAMIRHAMILSYQDEGDTARAIQLYEQLVSDFPQVEEWRSELRQLRGT